jgi:hypothetical protein
VRQPLATGYSDCYMCCCIYVATMHCARLRLPAASPGLLLYVQVCADQNTHSKYSVWSVLQLPRVAFQLGSSFLGRLEQQLQAVPGMDAVLAALVMFCQQNQAAASKLTAHLASSSTSSSTSAGSGGKPEAIDVSCLSSIQEQHTAARALPLLLRLYFNNNSRAEVGRMCASCAQLCCAAASTFDLPDLWWTAVSSCAQLVSLLTPRTSVVLLLQAYSELQLSPLLLSLLLLLHCRPLLLASLNSYQQRTWSVAWRCLQPSLWCLAMQTCTSASRASWRPASLCRSCWQRASEYAVRIEVHSGCISCTSAP